MIDIRQSPINLHNRIWRIVAPPHPLILFLLVHFIMGDVNVTENHTRHPSETATKNYAYHKGDTYYGHPNSLETITGYYKRMPRDKANAKTSSRIYEIDVIMKPPFLVSHDPWTLAKDVFIPINDAEITTEIYDGAMNKKLHNLSETEIRSLMYRSGDTPMILEDLLTVSSFIDASIYLDIKSPFAIPNEFVDNGSDEMNKFKSYTVRMFDAIVDTCQKTQTSIRDVVNTIISFDDAISILMRKEIDKRKLGMEIDMGMFVYDKCTDPDMNQTHHDLLYALINPTILSYKYDLIASHPKYLSRYISTTIYMWTVHVDELEKIYSDDASLGKVLDAMNVIWVVDNYER